MASKSRFIRLAVQNGNPLPPDSKGKRSSDNLSRQLLNCEERLTALVDSVVDYAIFMLDPAGIITSWNHGAERIKGYTAIEILGQHFSRFYLPADIDRGKPKYHLEVAASVGRCEDEGLRLRKDGSTFWANVVITAVRDKDGNLVGFSKVTRDLTERRHAEQALRESEARFRLLVDGIVDYGIFMLNPIGIVTSWNTGAERLMGYKANDIIGSHFSQFFLPEDAAAGNPKYELDVAAALGHVTEQGWRQRADGTTFWAEVTVSAVHDAEQRLIGFAKVTHDLSARKAADEKIDRLRADLQLRMDTLATANADLEAFSRSMAHDLRTPLRHVLAYTDLLIEEHREQLPPAALDNVMHTKSSATHMADLLDSLLGWFTITRREVRPDRLALRPLVESTIAQFKTETLGRAVEWRISNLFELSCDRALVLLLFQNLIGNALKFSRGRTPAIIEIGHVATETGRVIFVRDNGVGFNMEEVGRLFHAFERLHAAEHFEGTGIGLTIAARIVQKHGGRIWADSAPDQGATFSFTLEPGTVR